MFIGDGVIDAITRKDEKLIVVFDHMCHDIRDGRNKWLQGTIAQCPRHRQHTLDTPATVENDSSSQRLDSRQLVRSIGFVIVRQWKDLAVALDDDGATVAGIGDMNDIVNDGSNDSCGT